MSLFVPYGGSVSISVSNELADKFNMVPDVCFCVLVELCLSSEFRRGYFVETQGAYLPSFYASGNYLIIYVGNTEIPLPPSSDYTIPREKYVSIGAGLSSFDMKIHTYKSDGTKEYYNIGDYFEVGSTTFTIHPKCKVRRFAMYNRQLTDDEWNEIINSRWKWSKVPKDGLVAYYAFCSGKGNVVKDYSGNGFDGSCNNCKWIPEVIS